MKISSRGFIIRITTALLAVIFAAGPVWADEMDEELLALKKTSRAFVRVSREVTPSVVNIKTYRRTRSRRPGVDDPLFGDLLEPFREFFGRDFVERFFGSQDKKLVQVGLGSGVIVRKEGIILTNNHVIKGADLIKVTFFDKTEAPAEVVGSDPRTDIAVLRLPERNYPAAKMGDSDVIEVGDWAIAIGNPFGLGQSVTVGIVSAKGRASVGIAELEDFIQTDAAINPGNSGGPLITLEGEVIGINTAIFSRSGGYQGIGFAVPSNLARSIMEGLLRTGRIIRSDIGIRVHDLTPTMRDALDLGSTNGVIVSEVMEGSPSEEAGIIPGDVILKIRDRETGGTDTFYRVVDLLPVGDVVPVQIKSNGENRTVRIRVGELLSRPQSSPLRLRTSLGIAVEELTENLAESLGYRYDRGVLITRITRYSQADRVGLEPGDLVVKINGKPTQDLETFREVFQAIDWGENVRMNVRRRDRSFKVSMAMVRE